MVQKLLDAPNLPAFLNELITTQATTVAGTEAAGFIIDRNGEGFGFRPIAHVRPDASTPEVREAALKAFMELIKPCVTGGKDGAIELSNPSEVYQPETQYCLVTILRAEGQAVAVSAVITRCMNLDRAKQRLQSMQLVAGYFELFALRHSSEQTRSIAESHQHVLQLATAAATAEGFDQAATNLCNELANRSGASRVSLGWLKGERIKVKALSHTEEFDKKQELIVTIQRVMEECADQEEIVSYDPAGKSSENVTREAAALSRSQGGNIVLSLPLRNRAEVCGVITIEFLPNTQISPQVANGLAVAVEILAPQLYDRYQNDRYLVTKAGLSLREQVEHITGPRYMLAKVITAASIIVLLFVFLYRPMYHVSAPFQFGSPEKQIISAPYEGAIQSVGKTADGQPLRPGDRVHKGDVLVVLDTNELRQKQIEALNRAEEAQAERDKASGTPGKRADANIAEARRQAAQAEADLYELQIKSARVVAPKDGTILKGELGQKIGQKVQLGDELFELAPNNKLRPELNVNERDIQDVKLDAGGKFATDALPMDRFPLKVTRILPSPEAKEGSNTFTVYADVPADVLAAHPDWKPGMAGEARVDVGNRSLAWIWTHRLIDFLRVKLWM
ncbi:MAG TPA: HlyD family efflux transporter periplasmic adaptor subunit [Tepidisphaeraceae bacterium]|jgi:multidrug resistance efflux pump